MGSKSSQRYGIFIINFQDPHLKWIMQSVRTSILGNMRDNFVLVDAEAFDINKNSDPVLTYNVIKVIINDILKKYAQQNSATNVKSPVDPYEFWRGLIVNENRKTGGNTKAEKKGETNKANKAEAKRPIQAFQNVYHRKLKPSLITNLRTKEHFFDDVKIEDYPLTESGLILYILLYGFQDIRLAFEMLKHNLNVISIIYFYNNWEKSKYENDVLELRKSDLTQNVNITTQYLPILSKYKANKKNKEIYDEFCWYMYEIAILRDKYNKYLKQINELDVTENKSPISAIETVKNIEIPETAPDDLIVLMYLDALINLSCSPSDGNYSNVNYEYDNDNFENEQDIYNVNVNEQEIKIFHNDNRLLKLIYASDLDPLLYENIINFLKTCSLSYNTELFSNNFAAKPYKDTITKYKNRYKKCYFIQQYNANVFIQNVNCLLINFDKVILSTINANTVFFGQNKNGLNNECEKTFVIINKICFRDFCYYVLPVITDNLNSNSESEINNAKAANSLLAIRNAYLSQFIRYIALKNDYNYYKDNRYDASNLGTDGSELVIVSSKKIDYVTGYGLGNTRQQINFTEYFYRSDCISVRCYIDKWIARDFQTRINTTIFENYIFYNKKELGDSNNAIRLMTKCGYGIVIDLLLQNNDAQIDISWPTKLFVKAYFIDNMRNTIEQKSVKQYNKEAKRTFFKDGTLIIFYNDNLVTVLRPNGTIYCTTILSKALEKECIQPSYLDELFCKYQNEIEYIKMFKNILDTNNFLITTSDGLNFEIENNIMKVQLRKFLVTERRIYPDDVIYVHREDDVKIVYRDEYLECNYPNGTCIRSYLKTMILFDFDEDENEGEDEDIDEYIKNYEEDVAFVTVNSIIDIIIGYITGDIFITYEVAYDTEHEKYAHIYFSNDNIKITNPEDISVMIEDDKINVELEDKISILYTKDNCTISSTKTIRKICNFRIELNFFDTKKPLFKLNENKKTFRITHNNICEILNDKKIFGKIHKNKNDNNIKKIYSDQSILQSKIFKLDSYGGSIKCTKNEYISELQKLLENNTVNIYNSVNNEYICLLLPLIKFEEIYKNPPNNVENLKKFEKSYFIFDNKIKEQCGPVFICETDDNNIIKCSPMLTYNVYFKRNKNNDLEIECSSSDHTGQSYENNEDDDVLNILHKPDETIEMNENKSEMQLYFHSCTSPQQTLELVISKNSETETYSLEEEASELFVSLEDILSKAVHNMTTECNRNLESQQAAKSNALELKLQRCKFQNFGVSILQTLILCNIFPNYYDMIDNTKTPNEIIESYLKARLSKNEVK